MWTGKTAVLYFLDLIERRSKGYCLRCGEEYHSSHHCSERQLRLVVLGNDQGEVITIEVDEEVIEEAWEYNTMRVFGFPNDVVEAKFRVLRCKDDNNASVNRGRDLGWKPGDPLRTMKFHSTSWSSRAYFSSGPSSLSVIGSDMGQAQFRVDTKTLLERLGIG